MTSVQDSINALYAEAERNAKDGTPIFPLLQRMRAYNVPVDCKPTADTPTATPMPAQPDVTAIDVADVSPPQMSKTATAHKNNPIAYADQSRESRFEALRMLAEREVDAAPQQDDMVSRSVAHDSMDSKSLKDTAPLTHTAGDLQAVLPEQPPAPETLETDKDLDITDIHRLVQQAWEDGEAGMASHVLKNQDRKSATDDALIYNSQSTHDQTDDKQNVTDADNHQNQAISDISIAMENIAAAVKDQQPPTGAPLDVDALKVEIVRAVKNEFRQTLRDDIAPVVRSVVIEVMAEVSAYRAAPKLAVKSPSASASAKKTIKSRDSKAASTVQTKAPAEITAKSSSAKSTGTKTKAKAKTVAKKTRTGPDVG